LGYAVRQGWFGRRITSLGYKLPQSGISGGISKSG
jgi:hypothetical protein